MLVMKIINQMWVGKPYQTSMRHPLMMTARQMEKSPLLFLVNKIILISVHKLQDLVHADKFVVEEWIHVGKHCL